MGYMCGFGAIAHLDGKAIPYLGHALGGMNKLLAHRGPDDEGIWLHDHRNVGLAHRRLEIIGLADGHQPMTDPAGNWISYNGEIFNYIELRTELGVESFQTGSDTEVVLASYRRWGPGFLERLRGMFAFALWDESADALVLARDRFGIKPLYFAVVDNVLYAASEIKALLPFLPSIETDEDGLRDYFTFQFTMAGKTLFKGVRELLPGHWLLVKNGSISTRRYWEVEYEPDLDHTERFLISRLRELTEDSVAVHVRADVPVGAYLSGGLDSSIVATLAARTLEEPLLAFTGTFDEGPRYDESGYAREVAAAEGIVLHEVPVTPEDFTDTMSSVAYHLDQPVAGPGAFPQFVVSRFAARHRKVVLGGQGGDEIFGGYARYLLAYFEQCIKAAIDGTSHRAPFIVTYESIIPNLRTLREYKPLMQEFWQHGLFEDLDQRYFRLIDRGSSLGRIIDPSTFSGYSPLETFLDLFRADNVGQESYFDRMTHFDFKTLLPALLHVEDRVSMAHGLESRVPFVDHEVVEFAATLPALVKFKNGELKHALRAAVTDVVPPAVLDRRDKMGFPVPLHEWTKGPVRTFVGDTLTGASGRRFYLDPRFDVGSLIDGEHSFGRGLWALLSLELWQLQFHDKQSYWDELGRRLMTNDRLANRLDRR
jgi:asparagine synthase (glutamine-hydrolysing)